MTTSPALWLPESAFAGPAAVTPLGPVVAGWAARWLAADRITLPPQWVRQDGRHFPGFAAHAVHGEAGFALVPAARGEAALTAALLGQNLDHNPVMAPLRGAGDTALLRQIAQAARDDLAARITEWLAPALAAGTPQPAGAHYSLLLALGDDTPCAVIVLPEATLITLARLRAAPLRPGTRLQSRRDALDRQTVALAPVIGRNRIALAELEKLGPGDVIPLDTPVNALLDMTIGPSARAAAAASITLANGHFEIRIERSPQQW